MLVLLYGNWTHSEMPKGDEGRGGLEYKNKIMCRYSCMETEHITRGLSEDKEDKERGITEAS